MFHDHRMPINVRVHMTASTIIFRYQQGLGKIFVPTHLRLPSWIIGFITGIIFVDYPMGTIRIPKVANCNWLTCMADNVSLTMWKQFGLPLLEIEYLWMVHFISTDRSDNNGKLPIFPAWCTIYSAAVWSVQCVLSSIVCCCTLLHNFCVCSQCWRADQLVFVTSTLASNQCPIVWHLHGALFSCNVDNNPNESSALFRQNPCDPVRFGKFHFICSYRNTNDTSIWTTIHCNRTINIHEKMYEWTGRECARQSPS